MPLVVDIEVVSFDLATSSRGSQNDSLLGNIVSNLGLDQIGPGAPHLVYTVHVRVLEPEIASFELRKRFSEFADLDLSLSSMTKFLPYFPPRGAHRNLARTHGEERMKLLNSYFRLVCRMEEVVHTTEFITFFNLTKYANLVPARLAEVQLGVERPDMQVSSVSAADNVLVVARSSSPSVLAKATHFISSLLGTSTAKPDEGSSELQIWFRLPNSLLFERRLSTLFSFRITCSAIFRDKAYFGSSDGRIGFCSTIVSSDDSGGCAFLTGLVHIGAVTCMVLDDESLWTGGEDGVIQRYSFRESRVDVRMSSNGESAGVTAICASGQILFVGLSTGVINVFQGPELRLVTLLQGPFTRIVALSVADAILTATHSGGLVDSSEEANTVQFWDVSDVLSRGTSKLAHWGPAPSAIVGACQLNEEVAIVTQTGAVNVFTPTRTHVTNRARFIFQSQHPVGTNCFALSDGVLFIGGGADTVVGWKLPPFADSEATSLQVSTPAFSQVVEQPLHHNPVPTIRSQQPDEDDLHSWAR